MDFALTLIRILLRIFWLFPIDKKKVVLTAYNGRQFGCSPKYLAIYLAKEDRRVFYALRNKEISLPLGIHFTKYKSLGHFYHLMTAKYIVINSTGLSNLLPYRKQQVLINTWHGGGYFKVMGNDFFTSSRQKKNREISGRNTSYFLASCEAFAEQLPRSMSISDKCIFRSGLPRNDLFFSDTTFQKKKVCSRYNISDDKSIVIYAPTYRDGATTSITNSGFVSIDVKRVLDALKERFNADFVFVFRAHHDMLPDNLSENTINASDYDDMQELLAASDIFITDYSSCMWDYSLQRKPGFLYVPDLCTYEAGHPFGTRPIDWPYKLCFSNDELEKEIIQFDYKACMSRIENFLAITKSYENGHATEDVVKNLMPIQ